MCTRGVPGEDSQIVHKDEQSIGIVDILTECGSLN
jgi:hypothetical protein